MKHRDSAGGQIKKVPTEFYFSIVKERLKSHKSAAVTVTGVSMKPFLYPLRDSVVVVPYDGKIKRGDVALFDTRNNKYILHRVTRVYRDFDTQIPASFDMRGDNTDRGEDFLPCEMIVGMVKSASRNGRQIEADSFLWRFYRRAVPLSHFRRMIWNRRLRPVLAKIYRSFVPIK